MAYFLNGNFNVTGSSDITIMMFALFNQVEEWKSARKKSVLENKNGVTGAKANIQKGNDKKKN